MWLRKRRTIPPHEAPLDRDGRDRLAEALEGFLNRGTTNHELDEVVSDVESNESDPTLKIVCDEVWGFYDDINEHTACLSKDDWDYLYRLLLLLRSDGHIEETTQERWSVTQIFAFITLGLFFYLTWWRGVEGLLLAIPLMLVIGVLGWMVDRQRRRSDENNPAMVPFSSITELIQARRNVPDFRKEKYRAEMAHMRIRSPIVDYAYGAVSIVTAHSWVPFILLFLMMPETDRKTRVVFRA